MDFAIFSIPDASVDPVDEEVVPGERLGTLGGQQRRGRGVVGLLTQNIILQGDASGCSIGLVGIKSQNKSRALVYASC